MKKEARELLYQPKFGITNKVFDELCKIDDYIKSKVIFTNEGGTQGNSNRLDKIDFQISTHNNALSLALGDMVRIEGMKYLYIFGCQDKNVIYLTGYYKNGDTRNNLIKDEISFDLGSLKDFIFDRAYNYVNELEAEYEWLGKFEYQRDIEEMESEME